MKNTRIAVLGLGMMGQAIAGGLVKAHHAKRLLAGTTRTRAAATRLKAELGIAVGTDNVAVAAGADVLVLALKPLQVLEVARELAAAGAVTPRTLVISIAAGVTTAQLEEILGPRVPVIRDAQYALQHRLRHDGAVGRAAGRRGAHRDGAADLRAARPRPRAR